MPKKKSARPVEDIPPVVDRTWKAAWETEDNYLYVGRGWDEAEEDLREGWDRVVGSSKAPPEDRTPKTRE